MATEVLATLEARVRDAAERIRGLRQENERLAGRVRELEAELGDRATDGAAEWQAEREDIRRRVEALSKTLEGLLEE